METTVVYVIVLGSSSSFSPTGDLWGSIWGYEYGKFSSNPPPSVSNSTAELRAALVVLKEQMQETK